MNRPNCTNPQHPPSRSKEMTYLGFEKGCHLFACQGCKDVNHKMSTHVITDKALKGAVRAELRKEGRLMTEAPKTVTPSLSRPAPYRLQWDDLRRRSKDGRFELVKYESLGNGDIRLQMAVDGRLAPMMDDHLASREEFPDDNSYFTRIANASELMLHLYGDARTPLSESDSQSRQQQTF